MSIKKITEQNKDIHNEMEKALDTVKDLSTKEMLTNVWKNVKNSDLYKEVEEVKNKIINAPNRPEQLIFSFIPHEMAKVSIFFPMSDKELKEGTRIIQKIEQESSWGKIVIEGIKLAIFEEDIFLALMSIAKKEIECSENQFILNTNIYELIRILYGRKGYNKKSYERIDNTFKNFQLNRFEITIYNKNKEKEKVISIGSIIQTYEHDPKTHSIKIKFNPDFFAYFLESMLTNINFTLRRKLKKDGSKALLRFLTAHNHPSRMHILTVLNAINYNVNQPMKYLRRKIKQFIAELKANDVLGIKTKLYKDDTVYFDILPFKKALPD
ncbi:MAG: hypothetical protein ABH873_01215 [Candidatus Firestonebacteria bacterium]